MSLHKSVGQTAVSTIPLQKSIGIQSFRPLLFYLLELFDFLNFEAFLYGSWCKLLSLYLPGISGPLGRTDSYILFFFCLSWWLLLFSWQNLQSFPWWRHKPLAVHWGNPIQLYCSDCYSLQQCKTWCQLFPCPTCLVLILESADRLL